MIVTISGNPGCGKTSLIKRLESEHGFHGDSGSGLIRAWGKDNDFPVVVRSDYTAANYRMRAEVSPTYIADSVLKTPGKVASDGLRCILDFNKLRQLPNVWTFALWCPFDERLRRHVENEAAQGHQCVTDPSVFRAEEQAEYDDPNPFGQHTLRIMQQADFHIDASKSQEEVWQQFDSIYKTLANRGEI